MSLEQETGLADKSKSEWTDLLKQIIRVVKHSKNSAHQYAAPMFENEEAFINKAATDFIKQLRQVKKVEVEVSSRHLAEAVIEKTSAMGQLVFGMKSKQVKRVQFKHSYLQNWMQLLQNESWNGRVVITCDAISQLIQSDGRLSQEPDLLVLQTLIKTQVKGRSYKIDDKPIWIDASQYPKTTKLKIDVVHGYDIEEAIETVMGNLPSLATNRGNFKELMSSSEVYDIERTTPESIINKKGNTTLGMRCFYYYGRALELDLYNSLVEPGKVSDYLEYFPVLENAAICKGIALGQLAELMQQYEVPSDEEDEQEWEEVIEDVAMEVVGHFRGYLQEQEQSEELRRVSNRIIQIRKERGVSLGQILTDLWRKGVELQ